MFVTTSADLLSKHRQFATTAFLYRNSPRILRDCLKSNSYCAELNGAGDGNRTRTISLEG